MKKANQNLPGMGGVFNTVNLHLYHYAGNNPVKYLDPDGNQSISSFDLRDMWGVISQFDIGAKITNLFGAALSGDKQAQAYAGMIIHEVGRETLQTISDSSSTASLVFLAIGVPEAAVLSGAVSLVADGLLIADDLLSENYKDAAIGVGLLVAGAVISDAVSKGVSGAVEKGLKISVGRNGQFYSLGRRGAMKTWDATKALIQADIADSVFGDLAPEAASQLLDVAKNAYDALQE